ncbi:MAG: hypothetical protein ACE5OR_09110, partial [bacterium]
SNREMGYIFEELIRRFNEASNEEAGDTAVASYQFEIDWVSNGEEHSEIGHDVLVFVRKRGKGLAVWRAVVPQPKRSEVDG